MKFQRKIINDPMQTYQPQHFAADFVEAKGSSSQLGMYMSLLLGFKPLLDDWIPIKNFDAFKKVCRRHGIYWREDIIFCGVPKYDQSADIIGRDYLTTTSAYAALPGTSATGEIHVFLSKDKSMLRRGMWYGVTIKGRVIFPPRIDTLKYGRVLGYPECCIKFFRKFNNWVNRSHLVETLKHTKGPPSFLCNPFLKDTSFSYIYHMPCSYCCANTMRLANKLRQAIIRREPQFVKLTDRLLRQPFLAFYEKKCYLFEGTLKKSVLHYKNFRFLSWDSHRDVYRQYLKKADTIRLEDRTLFFSLGSRIARKINVPLESFAPEYPFFIQFQ